MSIGRKCPNHVMRKNWLQQNGIFYEKLLLWILFLKYIFEMFQETESYERYLKKFYTSHFITVWTSVHLLIHAVIMQSANHEAAASCIKSCRYKSRASVKVRLGFGVAWLFVTVSRVHTEWCRKPKIIQRAAVLKVERSEENVETDSRWISRLWQGTLFTAWWRCPWY